MIAKTVSFNQITVIQAPPPVAVVMLRDILAVVRRQVVPGPKVVVMVEDGVEAVGMETVWASVGAPMLRLPVVEVGVVILMMLLLLLLRWRVGIGQLVVSVQEGLAVSAGDGADGGVHPGAVGGGGGGGGALAGGRRKRRSG